MAFICALCKPERQGGAASSNLESSRREFVALLRSLPAVEEACAVAAAAVTPMLDSGREMWQVRALTPYCVCGSTATNSGLAG
jgi:hypothetical protein